MDSTLPPKIRTEEVVCTICQSPSKDILEPKVRDVEDRVPGTYGIARCKACGFIYLSPRPEAESLPRCYANDYHTRQTRDLNPFLRFLFERRFKMRFDQVRPLLPETGPSILEIGCGDGQFLVFLERNLPPDCRISGTDLVVDRSRLPLGTRIELVEGEIEHLSFPERFDLVIMHEVLEHLRDPVSTLRRIATFIRPGGYLVGQVPDWDSPWRTLFPRHWGGLQVPRHQSFFTRDSLRMTLESVSLEACKICAAFDPGDLGVSLCNWIADSFRLTCRPRQAWFYFPVTILSAPITYAQTILLRGHGEIRFVATLQARKSPELTILQP